MSKRNRRRVLSVFAGAVALAAVSLTATAQAFDGAPSDAEATTAAATEVDFRGYRIEVPTDWKVIDLDEHPDTCVRYDRKVLYLGTPGDQATCPTDIRGRTTAMLIQPLTEDSVAAAPRVAATPDAGSEEPSNAGMIQFANERAGVLVKATHGPANEAVVRDILRTADVIDADDSVRLRELREARDTAGSVPAQGLPPQPGTYGGDGFDTCAAPSQEAMDAWSASPFQAVGVYISGSSRGCDQPNLTAEWVQKQVDAGWHLIPLEVGPQAPCTDYRDRISTDPATARAQGAERAEDSVRAAKDLGLPPGSALYNDIEAYPRGGECSTAVRSFVSGWTVELHAQGYLSGVYSSGASGVADLNESYDDPNFTRPDHIHFAWWNDQPDTDGGEYIDDGHWADGQRIHQYKGDHDETHGGVTINIDSNWLDVKEGNPTPPSECARATLDFTTYPLLKAGSEGAETLAAQCLLKSAGLYEPEPPTATYDEETSNAAKEFQRNVGLSETGEVGSRTWTALLSAGSTPTLEEGTNGAAVTRLQRSLTAALDQEVGIDGAFGPLTEAAVREYQDARGLQVDGIVGPMTWQALQAGE